MKEIKTRKKITVTTNAKATIIDGECHCACSCNGDYQEIQGRTSYGSSKRSTGHTCSCVCLKENPRSYVTEMAGKNKAAASKKVKCKKKC